MLSLISSWPRVLGTLGRRKKVICEAYLAINFPTELWFVARGWAFLSFGSLALGRLARESLRRNVVTAEKKIGKHKVFVCQFEHLLAKPFGAPRKAAESEGTEIANKSKWKMCSPKMKDCRCCCCWRAWLSREEPREKEIIIRAKMLLTWNCQHSNAGRGGRKTWRFW